MLLWACKKYCCCKYNMHEITPYSIHESPHSRSILVELGKVEGFWSTLRTATASTSHIFECWAESSLATGTGENQLAVPCNNDVIRSDCVRPIGQCHLELMPELCICSAVVWPPEWCDLHLYLVYFIWISVCWYKNFFKKKIFLLNTCILS